MKKTPDFYKYGRFFVTFILIFAPACDNIIIIWDFLGVS